MQIDFFICLSQSFNVLDFALFAHGFVLYMTRFWNDILSYVYVLHFCVCQDHVLMVCNNTSCVSIACCKWRIDAGFVALEKRIFSLLKMQRAEERIIIFH